MGIRNEIRNYQRGFGGKVHPGGVSYEEEVRTKLLLRQSERDKPIHNEQDGKSGFQGRCKILDEGSEEDR